MIDDRILTVESSRTVFFDKPIRVVGYVNDEEAVSIELITQRVTAEDVAERYNLDPVQVLGNIYATADIKKPKRFRGMKLTTVDGTTIEFDNKEDSIVGIYERQGFILRGDRELPDRASNSSVTVSLGNSTTEKRKKMRGARRQTKRNIGDESESQIVWKFDMKY